MKKFLVIATLILLGSGSAAHAVTLDVGLGNANNSFSFGTGGVLTPNVNLASPSPASVVLNNNSFIVTGSVNSNYTQPIGTIGPYLAVKGTGNPGVATFNLASGENIFAFKWGTIDAYNSLLLTDTNGHTFSLTGADILAHIGNPVAGSAGAQTDVFFKDPFGSIVSAVLQSSRNSFEAANFYEGHAALPLPGSFAMFGIGLAGLLVMAQRAKSAKG